jgi:hypothetical protein
MHINSFKIGVKQIDKGIQASWKRISNHIDDSSNLFRLLQFTTKE